MLDDICRCHDFSCLMKDSCMRWVFRFEGGGMTTHAKSLREGGICKFFIGRKEEKAGVNNTSLFNFEEGDERV